MTTTKQGSWKNWTIGAVLAGGLVFAGSAGAHDRQSRHDHDRHVRKGHAARHHVDHDRSQIRRARREDRRLDQHGALIDLQLDGLALLASVNGEYELAHALDLTGDHIQRRLDRKGDRRLRQARRDFRAHRHSRHCGHGDRIDRRHSRRHHAKHHVRHDHRGPKRHMKHGHRKHGHYKRPHHSYRSDRRGDHSDWISDRARESKRDRRDRRSERWDD